MKHLPFRLTTVFLALCMALAALPASAELSHKPINLGTFG